VGVQDAMEAVFDDFTVSGPEIPGNGLDIVVGRNVTLTWPNALTNYSLMAASELSSTSAWSAVTNTPVSLGDQSAITLTPSPGNHFYLLAPRSP
jgi:hypothetical protein